MGSDYVCDECGTKFDYLDNALGDYTDLVGTEHDGCILTMCPHCKEEIEIPQ